MGAKVFAFLALAAVVRGNDVIVGLKTDGKKFFDENRQANPALWRQMDNVTINAPENEVIRRIVITDLRPEKDGDVRVVDGGEGQKNVTVELKSPTVLRGYDFHIEVYSTPGGQVPYTNDQPNSTENVQEHTSTTTSNNPTVDLDTTSKVPDLTTGKINPAILTNDEVVQENEREGRNVKDEDKVSTTATTEVASTSFKSDISTTPTTQHTESATEKLSDTKSGAPNKIGFQSTIPPIPLNTNFEIDPHFTVKDIANENGTGSDETRRVRDTEKEKVGQSTESIVRNIGFESSTENEKEATTTEVRDSIPIEEKFEDTKKDIAAPKSSGFDNHKYTSVISSKLEPPTRTGLSSDVKNEDKSRNVRGANEEQNLNENGATTIVPGETTTAYISDETTTLSNDDCVTIQATDAQYPTSTGKDSERKPDMIPIYLNNRQWNQRINTPTVFPDLKLHPAVLTNESNEQSTLSPDTADAESLGNAYRPSPDHMENRNPKLRVVSPN